MARRTNQSGRDETPEERADRNLSELLQELRVALPGVQILFAFLLTVPFAQGFEKLDSAQRDLYFGVLLSTVVATALLIAPSANHRVLFRMRDKENLVRITNRLTIMGLAVLSVSLTGAILLISDILFKSPAPAIFTALTGLLFATLWGVIPAIRRIQLKEEDQD
jgi:Family of unknown function (DUF6328)